MRPTFEMDLQPPRSSKLDDDFFAEGDEGRYEGGPATIEPLEELIEEIAAETRPVIVRTPAQEARRARLTRVVAVVVGCIAALPAVGIVMGSTAHAGQPAPTLETHFASVSIDATTMATSPVQEASESAPTVATSEPAPTVANDTEPAAAPPRTKVPAPLPRFTAPEPIEPAALPTPPAPAYGSTGVPTARYPDAH